MRVWSSGWASAFQADEVGSNPTTRSTQVLDAEAVEGAVCKTVLTGFESPRALQAEVMQPAYMDGPNPSSCRFDPHPPYHQRPRSSVVEPFLGKEAVIGSNPIEGSIPPHGSFVMTSMPPGSRRL